MARTRDMATTKKNAKKSTKKAAAKKPKAKIKKPKGKVKRVQKKKVQKVHIEGNLEVHPGFGILALNPGLFPLPVVYAASKTFLDKVYILIDGDPGEEIIIEMRPRKQRVNLIKVGREFSNLLVKELENYHKHTSPALDRYVLALIGRSAVQIRNPEGLEDDSEEQDKSYEEDPLGIMKPYSSKKGGEKR